MSAVHCKSFSNVPNALYCAAPTLQFKKKKSLARIQNFPRRFRQHLDAARSIVAISNMRDICDPPRILSPCASIALEFSDTVVLPTGRSSSLAPLFSPYLHELILSSPVPPFIRQQPARCEHGRAIVARRARIQTQHMYTHARTHTHTDVHTYIL